MLAHRGDTFQNDNDYRFFIIKDITFLVKVNYKRNDILCFLIQVRKTKDLRAIFFLYSHDTLFV